MTNKEKKECECVKYCGNIKGVCTHNCHEWNTIPDPLTSLLQSAEKEFDGLNIQFSAYGYIVSLPDTEIKTLKSFLLSKLTEAFNKGKEMR